MLGCTIHSRNPFEIATWSSSYQGTSERPSTCAIPDYVPLTVSSFSSGFLFFDYTVGCLNTFEDVTQKFQENPQNIK